MTTGKDVDTSLVEVGSTAEMAEALRASGAVDDLLAQIDTGEVTLTGDGGLLPGLIKLALERGLAAELTDHLGYEKGDPAGRDMPNGACQMVCVSPVNGRIAGRDDRQGRRHIAG